MELHLNAGIGSPHPECHDSEAFVCYANENGFDQVGWNTKRKGTRVIDDKGKDVTSEANGTFFPVFAQESELAYARGRTT